MTILKGSTAICAGCGLPIFYNGEGWQHHNDYISVTQPKAGTIKPPYTAEWSTEKPTQDGWYWYTDKIHDPDISRKWYKPVFVFVSGEYVGSDNELYRDWNGLWCPATVSPAPDLPTE